MAKIDYFIQFFFIFYGFCLLIIHNLAPKVTLFFIHSHSYVCIFLVGWVTFKKGDWRLFYEPIILSVMVVLKISSCCYFSLDCGCLCMLERIFNRKYAIHKINFWESSKVFPVSIDEFCSIQYWSMCNVPYFCYLNFISITFWGWTKLIKSIIPGKVYF